MTKREQKVVAKQRLYECAWKYVRALNGEGDLEEARARMFEVMDLVESLEILTEDEIHRVCRTVRNEYMLESKEAC